MVPGSPEKKTGRGIGGVPARELTGGELEVAREHEEVKARRGVGLVRTGVAGWVFSHGEVRRRPCCGGGMGVWRGLEAARRSGGAKGGVGMGGGGLEERTRGGVGLAGVEEEGGGARSAWSARPGGARGGMEGRG